MKILWIGDAACHTGFARVTHSVGDRLVTEYGHEVMCLGTNYTGDYWPTPMQLMLPTAVVPNDVYGQSRFVELAMKFRPDVIFMLNDPQVILTWILRNRYDPQRVLERVAPIVAYMPIDGYNTPPQYDAVATVAKRVAMSQHGQAAMPEAPVIYHGIQTDIYWPVSPEHPIVTSTGQQFRSKQDCKEALGFDRKDFVVGRVDSNSGRKDYGALWMALVPVMKRHSNVMAYWQCQTKGTDGGIDIPAVMSREPELTDRFRFPGEKYSRQKGYPESDLNLIYNAFDIFVSTSRGEGFGLTIGEALACGVPVIAQNCSSIPEVVGPGGTLIEPGRPLTVPFGQDQMLADIPAFTAAIERAYLSAAWRRDTGRAGREHVTASFQWDEATRLFHEYITEVLAHGRKAEEAVGEVAAATA